LVLLDRVGSAALVDLVAAALAAVEGREVVSAAATVAAAKAAEDEDKVVVAGRTKSHTVRYSTPYYFFGGETFRTSSAVM